MAPGLVAKRDAITRAALDVFVRRGYAATSLDDVATEAGVSRQTVYNHFGDKERLFLAVMDEALRTTLDELRSAVESVPPAGDGAERYLLEVGRRMVATFGSPRTAQVRLLVQSEAPRHPALRELWDERTATPVWSSLVANLARLAHAGVLDLDDPTLAAGQFVTLATGAGWEMTEIGTFRTSPLDPDQLDRSLRANVDLFLRAHRPSK